MEGEREGERDVAGMDGGMEGGREGIRGQLLLAHKWKWFPQTCIIIYFDAYHTFFVT